MYIYIYIFSGFPANEYVYRHPYILTLKFGTISCFDIFSLYSGFFSFLEEEISKLQKNNKSMNIFFIRRLIQAI